MAVGSEAFIRRAALDYDGVRWEVDKRPVPGGQDDAWVLRESKAAYGTVYAMDSAAKRLPRVE